MAMTDYWSVIQNLSPVIQQFSFVVNVESSGANFRYVQSAAGL